MSDKCERFVSLNKRNTWVCFYLPSGRCFYLVCGLTNTVNKARLGISSVMRLKLYFISTNLMNTH